MAHSHHSHQSHKRFNSFKHHSKQKSHHSHQNHLQFKSTNLRHKFQNNKPIQLKSIPRIIRKYGWISLIILIVLLIVLSVIKIQSTITIWLSSIIFFLLSINLILLVTFNLLKPFKWINRMDLSDDLKYYFTKILSFLVVIGLIIFFVIFGAGFFSILTIQNTFLDKISRIIYGIFFFGTGIWILCIGGFLGLRQRRRANGIFIWNK